MEGNYNKINGENALRLQAIFETAVDGIITINDRGAIETINRAGAEMFGYEREELIGNNVKMLMPEPYHSEHDGYLNSYHQTGEKKIIGIGREVKGKRKDGSVFPFRLGVAEFEVGGKRVYTGIVHDITDKEMAQLAQEALQKEKELNELKSKFISLASHEFRTPLTTIYTSATLIGKYTKEEQQTKRDRHIERIKAAVLNLNNILNDFLSLSKLEEGKTNPKLEFFDLNHLVVEVCEEMSTLTRSGQRIVQSTVYEDGKVYSDPKLMRNILINLLSNAIKYSEDGKEIKVHTNLSAESVVIAVEDQGLGISEEDQKQLYTRFFRSDEVQNIQGTGLGLHIVKGYVEILGGAIQCESTLGKGTTFSITFKRKEQE